MDQIGFALLSFAHGHQNAWAKTIAAHPNARVAAVWDEDVERGQAMAGRLGVPFEADLERVLGRRDVQAVTVCSENAEHADLAVAAAGSGKHIMMQKPMATTMADCDRIVDAVDAAGVTYMQSFNLRFDAVHELIYALVQRGEVGRLMTVRRRHSHHFGLTEADRTNVLGWMTDPNQAGGGALMDEGAHAALWFVWMFGVPSRVSAEVATAIGELSVDDHALITYRYPDALLGLQQTSWAELAGDATVEIYGDEGTIIATGADIASTRSGTEGPPLKVFRASSGRWDYPEVSLQLNRAELVAGPFIDCLVDGRPSPVPARWGRAAVEMMLAAYRSSAEGRAIELHSRL